MVSVQTAARTEPVNVTLGEDGAPICPDVAICGMAMRLPGGIRSEQDFWEFLMSKEDARTVVPADRYNVDAFYSAQNKPGTISTRHGYFLNHLDLANFDTSMFSLAGSEAEQVDPSHRLSLEVVREAFESAGETNWRGKPIGTYVGLFTEDWQDMQHKDIQEHNPYRVLGGLDFALPNRIAYEYDLRGPSMLVKTACSSAGIALHEALMAIRQGHLTSAIVCGANLILAPGMTVSMSLQMALSPEGSSKSFDASADGYARGEAVTAIYIKRLDEAIRDGNPIRAVVRSSASNADGKTNGISLPNPLAHQAVIRAAYRAAGLPLTDTAAVEAHGTGTKIGDPLEAKAIGQCFGEKGVYLCAVKPNLGHSEGAAALTSVIKAVLSLEHRQIVPNIKFNTPNPAIPWKEHKLTVPVDAVPWPEDRAERISINSYGIGGSNAHFILDSARSMRGCAAHSIARSEPLPGRDSRNVLFLSANHATALKKLGDNVGNYLAAHTDSLDDMAYTLSQRREHLRLRSFAVVDNGRLLDLAPPEAFSQSRHAAFVFTGQGAQWIHMGRELMSDYPSFRADIEQMDEVLQTLEHRPQWTIKDILLECGDKAVLAQAELSQPICTALQIALVNLLATWDIRPKAVVGHSSGEIAAAYAAGILSAKEAIIVAFYRGYVCKPSLKQGAMAAIGLSSEEVAEHLRPGVRVACENAPSSVTLSGDKDVLEEAMERILANHPKALNRKLQVPMAYHSHHMTAFGEEYRSLITEHLQPRPSNIPFYSSVYGKVLDEATVLAPGYWQENLESPVLFYTAVCALLKGSPDCSVHLEVGPHSALAGPLRQIYSSKSATIKYASALNRGQNDTIAFLSAIGAMFSAGVHISYPFVTSESKVLSDLPAYPWHYEKPFWAETRIMKSWRFREHLPHDLLGLRMLECSTLQPSWRQVLRLSDLPWLRDHCVGDDIVFPGAAYIAIAGEAVRQLRQVREYTVRNVEFSAALTLADDRPVEIVTTLKSQRINSSLESEWYDFDISSYEGSVWRKHCSGLVRSGSATTPPKVVDIDLSREVSTSRWYNTMARVGLNYRGRFVGLDSIRASVTERVAEAIVKDQQEDEESEYLIHPSTLDSIFQSLTVAASKGIYRDFTKLFLPTFIEELYVGSAPAQTLQIRSIATGKPGTIQGQVYATSTDNKDVVLHLTGFHGKTLVENTGEPAELLNTLQLQWKPHVDFVESSRLMTLRYDMREQVRELEKLYVLCATDAQRKLSGRSNSVHPHMDRYRVWLDQQVERFNQPEYPVVPTSAELLNLSPEDHQQLLEQAYDRCIEVDVWAAATAIKRACERVVDVYDGQVDYLDVLMTDGVLTGIYSWYNDIWDFQNLMQILGHTQPQMRILEIGGGTGGLTAHFLSNLRSDFGERLFWQYTFTDVSSGFFVQAKERFKDYEGMEYKTLDISKDPLEQGFVGAEYDLIIASNVLHATPDLHECLSNVRKLLKPSGRLFLQELCPQTSAMAFIMGQFSGWWLGEADGRKDTPFIAPEEWNRRLKLAGFQGCESVNLDNEQPYTYNANIIARPATAEKKFQSAITVLFRSEVPAQKALLEELTSKAKLAGIEIAVCEWGQDLPSDQPLISLVDVDSEPLLKDLTGQDLKQLLAHIDTLQLSAVLWVTPPAQVKPTDPHAAQMLGVARTVRLELAMAFGTLELEHSGEGAAKAIWDTFQNISRNTDEDEAAELDGDMEFAWFNNAVHVSRFHWLSLEASLANAAPPSESIGLEIATPGLLQTLRWVNQPLGRPAADAVNIKMSAVGLNFKDVMIAMGIIDGRDTLKQGTSPLGLEGCGHIVEIGEDVKDFAVGDRIMSIGCESVGMANIITRPASLCIKVPEGLSDEEGATMPVVYMTVLMFLCEKSKLYKDQTILIHSAAGGVGICAIMVAQWIGAKIYATVGSPEKVAFLGETFGIPPEHIFNSRDSSFREGIMAVTNGQGVDMVLNSLSGELLHTSWQCVAPHGTFVEIGKRDMIGRGTLALAPFEDNRTFMGGEVARILVTHKPVISRLLQLMVTEFSKGNFKAITPITTFEAEQAEEAFRFMQKGTHLGKIVIKFPADKPLPLTKTAPDAKFRGDVTYVLAGGMGGLGKSVASWMASKGARNLMFISRSAGKSEEDQKFVRELQQMGCECQCFACDIADASAIDHAVGQAHFPIAGVMQLAMVLCDIGVLDMDIESWHTAVQPKIQGTWNLHRALPQGLDFFVLFSSVGGMFGYYGQANYASGNTFLDAFVQYRQQQGQAASVMNIGPVGDVGYVSRTQNTKETLLNTLETLLTENYFLDTLHLAVAQSANVAAATAAANTGDGLAGYLNPAHIVHTLESKTPIMDPSNTSMWKREPRMAIYRNIQKTTQVVTSDSSQEWRRFLSEMLADPIKLDDPAAAQGIANELARCLAGFLMREEGSIETSKTFDSIGVDSLVAIEVRNWWRSNLGVEVSVLELMNGGSLEQLGVLGAARLKQRFASK